LATESHVRADSTSSAAAHSAGKQLGSFLCWAVVFADIGTSVYYVPGILYGQFGKLAGFFVCLTLSVFVLLTLKYAEVTHRFPEGGGVVTVATRAIHPWAGAVGGMLILVDYFLTAALSSLSGLTYFEVVIPGIGPLVLWVTIVVLALLGLLNWWGIKESAGVSAVAAIVAMISDLAVLLMVFTKVPLPEILHLFREVFASRGLTGLTLLQGFAGSFLAFSGLESISQLSPVMRVPRKRVAGWAMVLVVVTVGITSPLLTIFSTTLLKNAKNVDPNQFISALGGAYGGPWLAIAVAVSASALLIFASNTAIIGAYHVFLALTRMRFFPPIVGRYNHFRETPHVAIMLATGIPIAVLVFGRGPGEILLLGDLYAFGLLGAFTLTCIGLDIVRVRERLGGAYVGPSRDEEEREERAQRMADEAAHQQTGSGALARVLNSPVRALTGWRGRLTVASRLEQARASLRPTARALGPVSTAVRRAWPNIDLVLGILTTILVVTAWCTNIFYKPLATEFGGGVTVLGLLIAVSYNWWQARADKPAVYPMHVFSRMPNSLLVVLPAGTDALAIARRQAVIRTAVATAGERIPIFLYVTPTAPPISPQFMAIAEPFSYDVAAQQAFSQAESAARRAGIRRRTYIYRIGGTTQVADVWRAVRPTEMVAEADKGLAKAIQPDYVRFHDVDGTRVASYVHHTAASAAAVGSAGRPITPRVQRPEELARERPDPPRRQPGEGADAPREESARNTGTPAGWSGTRGEPQHGEPDTTPDDTAPAATGAPQPVAPPTAAEAAGPAPAAQHGLDAVVPPESVAEARRYVWTGTELKRREEVGDGGAAAADAERDSAPSSPNPPTNQP
jgi:amino acid transporter